VGTSRDTPPPLPTFVKARPLTRKALALASQAHGGQRREADEAEFILHPLEVAALLDSHGFEDCVTAAAVLHDTLEATDLGPGELEDELGAEVANLVRSLTEDEGIEPAERQKAALRSQVASAGPQVAAVFAADKVSKLREMRIRVTCDPVWAGEPDARRKLTHYAASLEMLEQALGDHPLIAQLRFELEAIHWLPPRGAQVAA
jgi:(p)ppGpp synthase/HD superfamily hydrolase